MRERFSQIVALKRKKERNITSPFSLSLHLTCSLIFIRKATHFLLLGQLLFLGLGPSLKLSVSLITKHICSVLSLLCQQFTKQHFIPFGKAEQHEKYPACCVKVVFLHPQAWIPLVSLNRLALEDSKLPSHDVKQPFLSLPPSVPTFSCVAVSLSPPPAFCSWKIPVDSKGSGRSEWPTLAGHVSFLPDEWKGLHNTAASHGHTLHQNARPCPNCKSLGSINRITIQDCNYARDFPNSACQLYETLNFTFRHRRPNYHSLGWKAASTQSSAAQRYPRRSEWTMDVLLAVSWFTVTTCKSLYLTNTLSARPLLLLPFHPCINLQLV